MHFDTRQSVRPQLYFVDPMEPGEIARSAIQAVSFLNNSNAREELLMRHVRVTDRLRNGAPTLELLNHRAVRDDDDPFEIRARFDMHRSVPLLDFDRKEVRDFMDAEYHGLIMQCCNADRSLRYWYAASGDDALCTSEQPTREAALRDLANKIARSIERAIDAGLFYYLPAPPEDQWAILGARFLELRPNPEDEGNDDGWFHENTEVFSINLADAIVGLRLHE